MTLNAKESLGMRLAVKTFALTGRENFIGRCQFANEAGTMKCAEDMLNDSIEHRGCGVRSASYELAPQVWLPEACVWLQTETGFRRLWIHSFAHCFDAEKLTFSNKFEADDWALGAARAIVDRALDEGPSARPICGAKPVKTSASLRHLARYCMLIVACVKFFR